MPAWNQTADLEENNLTDFNSTVDTLSALSAQAGAALAGSYGLQVALATSGVTPAYGVLSGPTAENDVTFECLIDPNTITVGTTLPADLGVVVLNTTGANVARLRLRQSAAGIFQLIGDIQTDAGTFTTTSALSISDAPHKVRMLWKAATGAGANNGFLHIYIDDVLIESVTGVDNDTKVVDNVHCGSVLGQDLGITGNLYFDNIRWYAGLEYVGSFSASMSSAGSLVKNPSKSLSGSVASAGALVRAITRSLSGAIATITGTVQRARNVSLSGSMSFSGSLVKRALINLFGSISLAGGFSDYVPERDMGTSPQVSFSAMADTNADIGTSPIMNFTGK